MPKQLLMAFLQLLKLRSGLYRHQVLVVPACSRVAKDCLVHLDFVRVIGFVITLAGRILAELAPGFRVTVFHEFLSKLSRLPAAWAQRSSLQLDGCRRHCPPCLGQLGPALLIQGAQK